MLFYQLGESSFELYFNDEVLPCLVPIELQVQILLNKMYINKTYFHFDVRFFMKSYMENDLNTDYIMKFQESLDTNWSSPNKNFANSLYIIWAHRSCFADRSTIHTIGLKALTDPLASRSINFTHTAINRRRRNPVSAERNSAETPIYHPAISDKPTKNKPVAKERPKLKKFQLSGSLCQ